MQCRELRADQTVRDAALRKKDTRILALLDRELVAAEAHYHRTCYRFYTKEDHELSQGGRQDIDDPETKYANALEQAEIELFSYIQNYFILNPDIIPMTHLTSKLATSLLAHGIKEVKPSTEKHLRRKLEQEFGETLRFVNDTNGKLLVYPASLKTDQLAKEHFSMREKYNIVSSQEEDNVLTKAALQLRKIIRAQEMSKEWPPDTEIKNCCVPEPVKSFFCTLLTGDIGTNSNSERVERLANSFGQDLVFNITNGREKPPKHVLLPFAVKSLTGNVELIQTLNRLGHGVSYSKLEEIDTALRLQKLSCGEDAPLPSDIHPGVFTTLAWDNIDRLEETLSGGGTSHRVNGIAVQRKLIGPLPDRRTPIVEKSKRRSITSETDTIPLYIAHKGVGPQFIFTTEHDTTAAVNSATLKKI